MPRTSDGCTPLHIAVWNEHPAVAEGLVTLGGDRHIQNKFGETAEDTAVVALGKSNKGLLEGEGNSSNKNKNKNNNKNKHAQNNTNRRRNNRNRGQMEKRENWDTVNRVAARICAKLKEWNRRMVTSAVRIKGVEQAELLLKETLRIEAAGGMMVEVNAGKKNKKKTLSTTTEEEAPAATKKMRRRTPGGVFLNLLRKECGPAEWKRIQEAAQRMLRRKNTSDSLKQRKTRRQQLNSKTPKP
mgnify:CR=1 FL=1